MSKGLLIIASAAICLLSLANAQISHYYLPFKDFPNPYLDGNITLTSDVYYSTVYSAGNTDEHDSTE